MVREAHGDEEWRGGGGLRALVPFFDLALPPTSNPALLLKVCEPVFGGPSLVCMAAGPPPLLAFLRALARTPPPRACSAPDEWVRFEDLGCGRVPLPLVALCFDRGIRAMPGTLACKSPPQRLGARRQPTALLTQKGVTVAIRSVQATQMDFTAQLLLLRCQVQ